MPTLTPPRYKSLFIIPLVCGFMSMAPHAEAQSAWAPSGTRGTWEAPTVRDDTWSVNQLPANLAFSEGFGVLGSVSLDIEQQPADGYQILASYSTRQSPKNFALGLGGGLHVYRSFLGTGHAAFGTTLALAAAYEQISFGLRYRLYTSKSNPSISGYHTGDISMSTRITRHLAASLNIENLWNPRLLGQPTPRVYTVGIGLQSSDGRLSGDISYQIPETEPRRYRELRASISGIPGAGLRLYLQGVARPWRASSDVGISGGIEWSGGNITTSLGAGRTAVEGDSTFFSGAIHYQSRPEHTYMPTGDSLLHITLSGELSEVETSSFLGLLGKERTAFTDLLWTLWHVESSRMAGVFIHLSGIKAGPAQLAELTHALERIRQAGKQVVVYVERGGIKELLIAAQATWAAVPPSFYAIETGISLSSWYFGEALDLLGVPAQFVATGDHKTGYETFTRNRPSRQGQAQRQKYLDHVFEFIVERFAREGRSSEQVRAALRNSPLTADELLELHIIDAIAYEDEIGSLLADDLNQRLTTTQTLEGIPTRTATWIDDKTIAVLHISGSIIVGQSGRNPLTGNRFTGSRSMERAIAAIRRDPRIQGVIVRIDSPGGSALASDEIRRGLEQLAKQIPTVISMGDSAASGGYYVASIDAPIFATPITLTGSIGVYAGTIAFEELLKRFGVTRPRSTRGGESDFFSGRTWDQKDLTSVQTAIDYVYERFISLISESRGLELSDVRDLADGRIYLGDKALEIGLVDHIGGFSAAYDYLCQQISSCDNHDLPLEHIPTPQLLSLPSVILAKAEQSASVRTDMVGDIVGQLMSFVAPGAMGVLVPYLSEEPGASMLLPPVRWNLRW